MDEFDVIKVIGEGAFGKAYLAKGKSDSKHCVIKEISFAKMSVHEKEASEKEVILLAKMKHPNIVAFFDSFQESNGLFIVMECCDGGISWEGSSGNKECYLVKISKNGMVAKLGDFGVARVLNNSVELARTPIGTPYYLFPEICQNQPYNSKTDIWSLGCVLYELCTLKRPFEGKNRPQLVLAICPARVAPIPPRFSRDLWDLVPQLLRAAPRDRPSAGWVLRWRFLRRLVAEHAPPEIKMIESPKHAEVCGHHDLYYAALDILRKRAQGASYHHVPWRAPGMEASYCKEGHGPLPAQWPAEYLQQKFEAQQYKLKVEEQLGLCPSFAEPNSKQTAGLRSQREEPGAQELQLRRKEMKDQEQEDDLDRACGKLRGRGRERDGCTLWKLREVRAVTELRTQDAVAAAGRRQWDARAPRTLLQMMAAADITSTCPTGPADGQVIVMEGVQESRKQWQHEAPGTLLSIWMAAHLSSSSFSASEGDLGTLKQWLPKEVGKVEMASCTEVDEELLEPAPDDDDTNFEESEDELRSGIAESLEKLVISKGGKMEEISSIWKDAEKSGERLSKTKSDELSEGLDAVSSPSDDQILLLMRTKEYQPPPLP